ncbi:hypothetical protein BDZ85DRAFT_254980 [Elsinoe ampelina]|uniref:Uncharacterized protein n=1 Tax=Elsinoe ampelina TaxID=302913 RepID=A0A6A6GQ32_9PEZI|nr:hypothetical protein BDZ85DRAFT_254980 [Elsinoe ampelina]
MFSAVLTRTSATMAMIFFTICTGLRLKICPSTWSLICLTAVSTASSSSSNRFTRSFVTSSAKVPEASFI